MDDDTTIAQIKAFIAAHPAPDLPADAMINSDDLRKLGYTPRILYSPASESAIATAEADLGLPIPVLLRRLYLEVSNGIAGFRYDIIGVDGGCASSAGTLVDQNMDLKAAFKYLRKEWRPGLLSFCDWGCCIWSCVDCTDPTASVLTYDNGDLSKESYTLQEFFEMWLKGKVPVFEGETVAREIINPFTGKKATIYGRRKRSR